MRILTVSNYYPPYFIGGYELGCRDIMELLRRRGHEILVLTSTHGVTKPTDETTECDVRRQLRIDFSSPAFYPVRYVREAINRRSFNAALSAFQPDLVYFWNQSWLSGSLVRMAYEAGVPYVFYLSDHLFLDWRTDMLWRRWIYPESTQPLKVAVKSLMEPLLRRLSLLEEHQERYYRPRQFTSAYLQRLVHDRAPCDLDRVIPWGVDPARFSYRPVAQEKPVRLLYVGQVEPHKGTFTAVRALAILRNKFGLADVTLTVVGGGRPEYLAELKTFAAAENLGESLRFAGKIDRGLLPAVYRAHDILIFPSEWEEPFALTPLEAMASGLAVVGTGTGGSKEIFEQEKAALIFAPRDATGCADAVRTLLDDPALYRAMCEHGRQLVVDKYSLKRMVDTIEAHLAEVLARAPEWRSRSFTNENRGLA